MIYTALTPQMGVLRHFRTNLGGRESNRTFLMGALFEGPYRAIAKTGLRPVLTIRPLTPQIRVLSFTNPT